MSKSNNTRKDNLLGMSHGTACNQLRKMVLFSLVQELKKDICFRCGKKIENIENLSIEHKEAWQSSNNPKESFFDLNNIAFSHLNCNISAGEKRIPHPNGRGESHPQAKLTENQIMEIKKKIKLGFGDRGLSKEYNVSRYCIWYIRKELSWKDI